MIGPSLSHSLLALAVQWGFFLPLAIWLPDQVVIWATGSLAVGIWFGRELEQYWPHIGIKPLAPNSDQADFQRFIRQGCWPAFFCWGTALLWTLFI